LRQLTPTEARLLDISVQTIEEIEEAGRSSDQTVVNAGPVHIALGIDPAAGELAFENLYRLRLLAPPAPVLNFIEPSAPYQTALKDQWQVTTLGRAFVKACRR